MKYNQVKYLWMWDEIGQPILTGATVGHVASDLLISLVSVYVKCYLSQTEDILIIHTGMWYTCDKE